jgi:NADH-quinone oxidoreductase subunit L
MEHYLTTLFLIIIFAPALGALVSGLLGKYIGVQGTNWVTISLMAVALALSLWLFYFFYQTNPLPYNINFYQFAFADQLQFNIGFLIDRLTVFMMVVVTFVSFLVHVYSMGYMQGDPGYCRFFSYISGFTFAMLALVMANNFLLLFFGWAGVGLFSYLLIGFWYERESANYASLKAFIANRVGDLGFLLGIAVILTYFGSIDYQTVFSAIPQLAHVSMVNLGHGSVNMLTLACLLLFLGAVGKSAQIPLHIWLEGSMEGPTPISALIHAATMVTAGVFMVARLSPMFEYSDMALSVVLLIGALTCFLMGLLGIVQNDIKRVIAYSTLSQLGYMMAAQGVSAYPIGMFHLMTHASFKALLFLAAGSVIVAMHHEQDIRKMGGLIKKLPITYICMLIGALALSGIPPFSGFFSKDLIIDAVKLSVIPGHQLAYFLVLGGTLVTALYTFRMFFLVFHGTPRMDSKTFAHVHESPWTILVPLLVLVVPTILSGMLFFHEDLNGFFCTSIVVLPAHAVMSTLQAANLSSMQFLAEKSLGLPCLLGVAGIIVAYVFYVRAPQIPEFIAKRCSWIYYFFIKKYFIDDTYDLVFGGGARLLGMVCYRVVDMLMIDRGVIEGGARMVASVGGQLRKLQTGFLYHYTLAMIVGLVVIIGFIWLGCAWN